MMKIQKYQIKSIPKFEGYYADTNGDIWSAWGMGKHIRRKNRTQKLRKLKKFPARGYLYVNLCNIDGRKKKRINRLIGETFLQCDKNKAIVAHKNGIKTDNRPHNLYWATHQENEDDKIKHNTRPKGQQHPNAKLTDGDVKSIIDLLVNSKLTYGMIAAKFNVTVATISGIAYAKSWKHLQFNIFHESYRKFKIVDNINKTVFQNP